MSQDEQRPHVRVIAVVNLARERVHGITTDQGQAAAWIREIGEETGDQHLSAIQCADVVDIPDATIAQIRAEVLRDAATAIELVTGRVSTMMPETAGARLTTNLAGVHVKFLREAAHEITNGGDPFADAAGGAS